MQISSGDLPIEDSNEETSNTINYLESVDGSIEMNDKVQRFLLYQDILNISEETIDQVFNKIQEDFTTFNFVTEYIEYVLKIRPKQTESLCSLLSKISKITEYKPSDYLLKEHRAILIQKGIIEEKQIRCPKEEIIEKVIREDSVEDLIKLVAQSDFNPEGKLKFNKDQSVYFVNDDTDRDQRFGIKVTYMQLMAYYGSVKCFKYAVMDDSFDINDINKYAIAGGNKEIIRLLEQKGIKFDNCFEVSIKFHRDEISDWLLRNYKYEEVELHCALDYFNIRAFYFLIKNKISLSKESFGKALIAASKTGILSVVKYFIESGVNKNTVLDGRTAMHYACEYGHVDIVRYLIELGIDKGIKDVEFKTPLHIASEKGQLDIVKYLLELGADKDAIDCEEETPLYLASENGHLNVVKFLIESGANKNTRDCERITPLGIAGSNKVREYLESLGISEDDSSDDSSCHVFSSDSSSSSEFSE